MKKALKSTGSAENNDISEYEEYLASHEDALVQIDSVYVDFGASQTVQNLDQQVQEKSISIFNKTKSKIVLYWNSSEKQAFKITPPTCEIPAMKSCSFRVKFEPVCTFIYLNEIVRIIYKCFSFERLCLTSFTRVN